MPTRAELRRNNTRAGVFVTLTLALIIAVIAVLSEVAAAFRTTTPYTVTYEVRDGISQLKRGSDVRIGGLILGKVTAIDPKLEPDAPFQSIDVHFTIDSRITLYQNARINIGSPVLGSEFMAASPLPIHCGRGCGG